MNPLHLRLSNGYQLRVIQSGEASPMEGHQGGEIAVDDQAHVMYAWEVFVVMYGLDSIRKACESYPQ